MALNMVIRVLRRLKIYCYVAVKIRRVMVVGSFIQQALHITKINKIIYYSLQYNLHIPKLLENLTDICIWFMQFRKTNIMGLTNDQTLYLKCG